MPTAVLIDGAYFVKRFRKIEPHNAHDARRASEQAFRWAIAHLHESRNQAKHDLCVFRTKVTGRFGIVTGDFGNVTVRSGDVTDRTGRQDWRCA